MTSLLRQLVCVVLSVLLLGCAGGTAGSGGVEVRGKVTSEQDLPIEGALVEILSIDKEPIAASSSDASGEFVFNDISERTGEIRITLPGREQPVVSSFSIPEGRNIAVVRVRDDSREGPTARIEYPEEDEPSEDDPARDDDDEDEPNDGPDFDNDDDGVEERPDEDDNDDDDDAPVVDDEDDDGEDVNDDVVEEDDGPEDPQVDDEDEVESDEDPSVPAEVEDD